MSHTFFESLQLVIEKAKSDGEITIENIFHILSGKGYASLLIIFSLPFSIPIQIPGFSTPFGIILSFLGLRLAFGRHLWWPKWILEMKMSQENAEQVFNKISKVVKKLQKFLHPRLEFIATNPLFHRMHGLLVFVLGALLALPLPIPMSNLLSAIPILCIGLGLLEDDGLVILIAYTLSLICFGAFLALLFVFI